MKLRAPKTPVFVEIPENAIFKRMTAGEIEEEKLGIAVAKLSKEDDWRWEYVKEDETLLTNGWWIDISQIRPMNVPKLSRNKKALLVKNSEWEVDEDLSAFFGTVYIDDFWKGSKFCDKVIKSILPAKTKIVVKSSKTVKSHVVDEVCVKVEIDDTEYWMPARFFGAMTCVVEGKEKTYWKILDSEDNPVKVKRYKNLAALKSGVMISCGKSQIDDDDVYWLTDSVSVGNEKVFDNWVAVEYKSKDNTEKQRIELSEWYTIAMLKRRK